MCPHAGRYLLVVTIALALVSCRTAEQRQPSEALSTAYADLLIYRDASRDADSAAYSRGIDSILTLHGYDRALFIREFTQLGTDANQVNAFFDTTNARIAFPHRSRE